MKRNLVTGGEGFLGSYVTNEISKNFDYNITILSNRKNVNGIYADITNKKEILEKVNGFDIIYHIAGNIRKLPIDTKKKHFDINAKGTLNILEACKTNNIPRLVFISTSEVYGKLKQNMTEMEKKEPKNEYGKSKLMAEEYCRRYANHIKITVVRPSYIYGHGQYHERLFPRLIEQAVKNKNITMQPISGGNDFVYVKDVAAGIVLLGERKQKNNFEDFNISSGKFTSATEVFDTVTELTGINYKKTAKRYEEGEKFSLSIAKAKKAGYSPKYNLKKGISDFIRISKENDNLNNEKLKSRI